MGDMVEGRGPVSVAREVMDMVKELWWRVEV